MTSKVSKPELHWTEIDGVKTVWSQGPVPLAASLVFRTGRADETLATSGRTHLIEHLAMWQFMGSPSKGNGAVSGAFTAFTTAGGPAEVSRFLAGVCEALRSLPGERLDAEKQVLLAEGATRRPEVVGSLLTARYGVRGYGLLGVRDLGFQSATVGELQSLAERVFCRENAFLWLSGSPPADLRLDLPEGEKQLLPRLEPVSEDTPCWFVDEEIGGIAAGAVVPRNAASPVFRVLCQRALMERLRAEMALSYAPAVGYDYLNADVAHLTIFADSEVKNRAELAGAFMGVFDDLGEFEEPDVEAAKKELADHWVGSLAPPLEVRAVGEVQRAAIDWVCGREFETLEDILSESMSVGRADVEAYGQEVQRQAMFALPGRASLRSSMGKNASVSKAPPVKGKKASHLDFPVVHERLIYGPDGVTVRSTGDRHTTVRYADLEGAMTNKDGRISLVAADGACVTIEPTLWRRGSKVSEVVKQRVPAPLLLDQGPRSPDSVPKPRTTRWQRLRAFVKYYRVLMAGTAAALAIIVALVEGQYWVGPFIPVLAFALFIYSMSNARRRRRAGI